MKSRHRVMQYCLLAVLVSLTGCPILPSVGTLQGKVVRSTNGTPIPNALVRLVNTPYECHTDSQGQYQLANVPVGTYTIYCAAAGYIVQEHQIEVLANTTFGLDFLLVPIP